MTYLQLSFYGKKPELTHSLYSPKSLGVDEIECVRGKDGLGFGANGSFQWSKAVKALSLLLIKHKLKAGKESRPAQLVGAKGSFAASLDNAIHKKCLWITDMFGVDSRGNMNATRIFRRQNPGLRRPGPVSLSLNTKLLPEDSIHILLDGEYVESEENLLELQQLIAPDSFKTPELKLVNNG